MLHLNNKGGRAITALTALFVLALGAVFLLGAFGKFFGVSFNYKLPIFLIIISLAIFIVFKLIVQSGETRTDIDAILPLLGSLALIIIFFVTIGKGLIPFAVIEPFSFGINELSSQNIVGLPLGGIAIILLILIIIRLKKSGRRYILRV